jgi:hypothetical protein
VPIDLSPTLKIDFFTMPEEALFPSETSNGSRQIADHEKAVRFT